MQSVLDRQCLGNDPHGGAIPRRRRKQKVGRLEAAGPSHGLRHHGRIAGNVLADETGNETGVIVVAAAGSEADIEVDDLTLEELVGWLG
jgi:hypothetical protein